MRQRRRRKTISSTVIVFLFFLLYILIVRPNQTDQGKEHGETQKISAENTMEVHFLDVGQSDCTLIICQDEAMLIDCGDDTKGNRIQYYLQKLGITELKYVILTHPDNDHIGGAPVIIQKFDIDNIFMSSFEKDNTYYEKLIQTMEGRYYDWETPEVGSTWQLGDCEFKILGPLKEYEEPNDASLVLKFFHGENTFLFTGDAQEAAEADMLAAEMDLQADVFKAGHHGSRTSNTETFLQAVSPTYAVISCGEGNDYGHPHGAVLNQLRALGVQVFRTDEQGTIVVISDGTDLQWNCAPSESWQAGS